MNLNEALSILVIIARLLTVIPLGYFLVDQWNSNNSNPLITRVRRVVWWVVFGIEVLLINLLFSRFQILLGFDPTDPFNSAVFLSTSVFLMCVVWYAVWQFKEISK